MSLQPFLTLKNKYFPIIDAIHQARGRPIFVGGVVRDILLNEPVKDVDIEVYGLPAEALEKILLPLGEVIFVGKSFGVFKMPQLNLDVSLARQDHKQGRGHRGFSVRTDPNLDFKQATSRRDLTINSIGYDPLQHVLLDPYGGENDLKNHILKATNSATFCEDPLRALRAAGFAARFLMVPDAKLLSLAAQCPLDELPSSRLREEFYKLLVKGKKPSLGLQFLSKAGLLKYFPEILALQGVPQNPVWHPEGDVWIHTLMALDVAAGYVLEDRKKFTLMLALLAHDFGKPLVTVKNSQGNWTSKGHEAAGTKPAETFLSRLNTGPKEQSQILCLIRHHLAPIQLMVQQAGDGAFRRLCRHLNQVGLSPLDLAWVSRMDYLGRATEDALAHKAPNVDAFLERIRELRLDIQPPQDIVQGRDLIQRGLKPGKEFSEILEKCRNIQDEEGLQDIDTILAKVGL